MTLLIETLIQGISLGSIYALIALGYTMVYGIAKMLNFAHGDVIMVGAYTIYTTISLAHFPGWLGVLTSVVFCSVLGIVIEFLAYKPLRGAPSLNVLITAIGISYLLQNLALLIFGGQQEDVPNTGINVPSLDLGFVVVEGKVIFTIVLTVVLMIALTLFINKTKMGKAMRAVSEDKDAARLMGINVNRTISLTFAIGSALAAFASLCYGMNYTYIKPTTGSMPGIKAFTAAVFGGIGSIPGAMLGGFGIGILEKLSQAYITPIFGEITDVIVFGVLIIMLVVRPTGLLGKKIREKV
ncbi:MAG: branched-chain amino acid ABC transporter permease [Clostridia bacterium]|nr:branched-chain amino acid ABC transporter permease [Clostridia bacterium]MBQ8398522.1 branched-chain amino acid ABC transporter permease [Clostridia bacterium]